MRYRDHPKERKSFRACLAILVGLLLLAVLVDWARADAVQTTWRTDDRLAYIIGCVDEGAARRVIVDGPPAARCFVVRTPSGRPARMPAVLLEHLSGPHSRYDGHGTASVWRALDAQGDTVYLPMSDEGGPHERAQGT